MAHVNSLETQLDNLKEDVQEVKTDVRSGFKDIVDRFDKLVPRSEMDLVCKRYDERLLYIENNVKRLDEGLMVIRRISYVAIGAGVGSIPLSSAISLLG